ncbi:MAG: hypothetical protein JWM68_5759 [Verrucomicrobiales bacterium]|nr:hypothetical protein [Verrucomicrobiales bacterium]
MISRPTKIPPLWVIPSDLIPGNRALLFEALLKAHTGCETWILDGKALAYSFPDIFVDRGFSLDYPKQLSKTRRVDRLLRDNSIDICSAAVIDIPDEKYWVTMCMSPNESESLTCVHFKNKLDNFHPFSFRAYSRFRLSKSARIELRSFLEEWITIRTTNHLFTELMDLGLVTIESYTSPGDCNSSPRDGFTLSCSSYVPCTWPWIDFYLQMRNRFQPKERLSLEFFNSFD